MKSKRNYLRDWSNSTTLHGIGHLARSQNTLILIARVCLFLLSLAFFLYNFTKTAIEFSSLRIDTFLSHTTPSDGITFPAVTICNLKYFNTADDPELDSELSQYIKMIEIYFKDNATDEYGLDRFFKFASRGYSNVVSDFERNETDSIYYRIKEMLMSCTFHTAECLPDEFSEVISDEYGKCFTFNAKGTKHIFKEGSTYGLRLELLIGNITEVDITKKHGNFRFLFSCY